MRAICFYDFIKYICYSYLSNFLCVPYFMVPIFEKNILKKQ